jgi:hypothetical protein
MHDSKNGGDVLMCQNTLKRIICPKFGAFDKNIKSQFLVT